MTYLLAPVLQTLLALRIAVLLVHEVERDKRANHASDDAHPDDGIHPCANLVWGIGGGAARSIIAAVEGHALLVGIALGAEGLGLDAYQLL